MNKEQAFRIYEEWQTNIEILDKITKIFSVIPESFLPYSVETLEKALNIVAEDYHNKGEYKTVENIWALFAGHAVGLYKQAEDGTSRKITDEEALVAMKEKLEITLENPKLKEVHLNNLDTASKSWAEHKGLR